MITRQQALELFERDDLIALGMAADQLRRQLHPEGLVSYSMEAPDERVMTLEFDAHQPVDQLVNRLTSIRHLHRDAITAIMPRSRGTAVEYLKILALTRILLDTVPHVQASWQTGLKLGQVALKFGADDINGAEAGSLRATEEDIRRIIRDAGFVPKQRDALFKTYFLT